MLLEQKETASSLVDVVVAEGNRQLIDGCCWNRMKGPAHCSMCYFGNIRMLLEDIPV